MFNEGYKSSEGHIVLRQDFKMHWMICFHEAIEADLEREVDDESRFLMSP